MCRYLILMINVILSKLYPTGLYDRSVPKSSNTWQLIYVPVSITKIDKMPGTHQKWSSMECIYVLCGVIIRVVLHSCITPYHYLPFRAAFTVNVLSQMSKWHIYFSLSEEEVHNFMF